MPMKLALNSERITRDYYAGKYVTRAQLEGLLGELLSPGSAANALDDVTASGHVVVPRGDGTGTTIRVTRYGRDLFGVKR